MQLYYLYNKKTPCIVLYELLSFSNIFWTAFYVDKCVTDAPGAGNRLWDRDLSAASLLGSTLRSAPPRKGAMSVRAEGLGNGAVLSRKASALNLEEPCSVLPNWRKKAGPFYSCGVGCGLSLGRGCDTGQGSQLQVSAIPGPQTDDDCQPAAPSVSGSPEGGSGEAHHNIHQWEAFWAPDNRKSNQLLLNKELIILTWYKVCSRWSLASTSSFSFIRKAKNFLKSPRRLLFTFHWPEMDHMVTSK